jgi:hypothetical protein
MADINLDNIKLDNNTNNTEHFMNMNMNYDPIKDAYKQSILDKLDKARESRKDIPDMFSLSDDIDLLERFKSYYIDNVDDALTDEDLRLIMMFDGTSTLENLNERFNPCGLHLKGWAKSFMSNKTSLNETLDKIYEKYNTKPKISPEVELLKTLVSTTLSFFTNRGAGVDTNTDTDIEKN